MNESKKHLKSYFVIYLCWILKAAGAGAVALLLLSLFAGFYYNPAVHINSETGSTSYTREANAYYSRGTEGFAWGQLDENGFNNAFPHDEDQDIDILMMGSSHIEAMNVDQKKCTSYLLNELFQKDAQPLYTYNIGMSSHLFLRQAANLKRAMETFQPQKYVILEVYFSTPFTKDKVRESLEDQLAPLSVRDSGMLYYFQKIPYFKLLYQQMMDYRENNKVVNTEIDSTPAIADDGEEVEVLLNELIAGISKTAGSYGCKAVIFNHPSLSLNEDGTVSADQDEQSLRLFSELCQKNNVMFLDMTDIFVENYYENHDLPTGFSNTAVGYGHINETGHRLIAEKLYEIITDDMGNQEGNRP